MIRGGEICIDFYCRWGAIATGEVNHVLGGGGNTRAAFWCKCRWRRTHVTVSSVRWQKVHVVVQTYKLWQLQTAYNTDLVVASEPWNAIQHWPGGSLAHIVLLLLLQSVLQRLGQVQQRSQYRRENWNFSNLEWREIFRFFFLHCRQTRLQKVNRATRRSWKILKHR